MRQRNLKKAVALLMFAFVFAFLCACSRKEPGPKTVVYDGKTYTIDEEAMTISDDEYTYRYQVSGGGSSVNYHITYPNGSTYYWTWSGNMGHGGWSDDYDETCYTEGRVLMNVLEAQMPRESEPKDVLMILVLLAIGIFNVAAPKAAWYLSDGWRFKDAEPSEAALDWGRFVGIILIVIAVFMILA